MKKIINFHKIIFVLPLFTKEIKTNQLIYKLKTI